MTLPSFATTTDLTRAGVQCASAQEATHVLWAVSTRIRGYAGRSFVADDGTSLIYAGSTDADLLLAADLLQSVTIEAAKRRLANPDGVTSSSETTGPFSESVTFEADNVFLSRQEKADIDHAVTLAYPSGGFTGLGTISTTRGPLETAAPCEGVSGDPIADDPFGRGW
jgi:hypothetical protein